MAKFECSFCSMTVDVTKEPKFWRVHCKECRYDLHLRMPKTMEAVDAFCFATDHLRGIKYRFVEVLTDELLDSKKLDILEHGLAYETKEVAAALKMSEASTVDLLWKAFTENKVERKKIKGHLYWLWR